MAAPAKKQGIEYWVAPAPTLAKSASLAIPASPAKSASLAKSEPSKEYKEELHEEPTHKELCVGVGSRFTEKECARYAEHLHRTGQGIINPGGYATIIHRSGEADARIELFLYPPPKLDIAQCPDCHGTGFKQIEKEGREGVVKCSHEPLKQKSDG